MLGFSDSLFERLYVFIRASKNAFEENNNNFVFDLKVLLLEKQHSKMKENNSNSGNGFADDEMRTILKRQ